VSQELIHDRTHVSYFTYIKLFLPELLPELDDILYLDVDILIRGPLDDLINWKLSNPIGAVPELSNNGFKLFGTSSISYFNAGVLRISLDKFREMSLTLKALELIKEPHSYEFQDQDIFNLIFRGSFDHVPNTFNVFHDYTVRQYTVDIFRDPIIVHFNGPNKPWNLNLKTVHAKEWRRNYRISVSNELESSTKANTKHQLLKVEKRDTQDFLISFADKFSSLILSLRSSFIGRYIRNRLPHNFKKLVNDFLYNSYKNFGGVKTVLDYGLFSKPESSRDQEISESPSQYPISIESKKQRATIFIISRQRSGTNALLNLISGANSKFISVGELFGGFAGKLISESLSTQFPWYRDLADSEARSDENAQQYFELMDHDSLNIIKCLVNDKKFENQIIVVKVFQSHLTEEKLAEILKNFATHVIFIRRRTLYTYISSLKARATGNWWGKDSSSTKVVLSENEVKRYISTVNSWFDFTFDLVKKLEIPTLSISYDGIFETKTDLPLLRSFLEEIVGTIRDIETLQIKTQIQDRRHESLINDLLVQFAELPNDVRRDLLDYPGKNFGQNPAFKLRLKE
jgi:lipopolysaccharide biosynthesis glycosyltransferase